MKLLFIARHFTYFRNFESAIAEMATRGVHMHLAADREESLGGRELVDALANRFPHNISVGFTPMLQWGRYRRLARALRLGLDYLRYSDPRYATTPKIRQRAYERTPLFALLLARLPFRGAVTRLFERLEQAVPRQQGVDDFIQRHRPDVLLITPLIELGSPQLDYVRAARSAGIPSALSVWSWDHLSSKALIRVPPDAVIVWNEIQREEAQRFHDIPPDRVIVTGAQCFDQWFDRAPSLAHDAFCRRVGLPGGPFLLYVCSALFRGSPSEATFVRDWASAIRQSSVPWLRDVSILVRPHPQRLDEWADGDALAGLQNVALWGSNPVTPESRSDYFDSIFHSAAVVGLNTSALVEAAIVDRPIFTVLAPEFFENQEGTFHFHYLLDADKGCLHAARTLDEHVNQLAMVRDGTIGNRNRTFVEQFIRPCGIGAPATPIFVRAIETVAQQARPQPQPQASLAWTLLLRPVVYALVLAGRLPWLERLYWNPMKQRDRATASSSRRDAGRPPAHRDKVARVHS